LAFVLKEQEDFLDLVDESIEGREIVQMGPVFLDLFPKLFNRVVY
jgi:hypothetical protein